MWLLTMQTKHLRSRKNLRAFMKWGITWDSFNKGWRNDTYTVHIQRNIVGGVDRDSRNAKHGFIRTKKDRHLLLRPARPTIWALQGKKANQHHRSLHTVIRNDDYAEKQGNELSASKGKNCKLEILTTRHKNDRIFYRTNYQRNNSAVYVPINYTDW